MATQAAVRSKIQWMLVALAVFVVAYQVLSSYVEKDAKNDFDTTVQALDARFQVEFPKGSLLVSTL